MHHDWAAEPHGSPQFDGYDDGLWVPLDDDDDGDEPFLYAGEQLRACHFPLGGFGTGRLVLCGDGTLQDWAILNQCRADDGGPNDPGKDPTTQSLDCMPANFFAVAATP